MFYVLNLNKELEIQPRYFGPKLKDEIESRLRQDIEGTCSGQYGFLIGVMCVDGIGKGLVREGVGSAVFNVSYQCVTYMPHKGETLDAVVKSVNKMGFFAEAGPLSIFVSNHLIADDYEFDSTHEPCYTTPAGDMRIEAGTEVRLKIVGIKIDAAEIFAVGTIKEDFLGPLG